MTDGPLDLSRPGPGRVVIAGGSGALGSVLADDLADRGVEVVILTRSPDQSARHRHVAWDGRTVGPWAAELDGAYGVVNLAGRLVDARPTRANIADLRASRVDATRALVRASQDLPRPVPRWLQASTTAIWSDAGEARLDETSPVPHVGLPQMTGVARPVGGGGDGRPRRPRRHAADLDRARPRHPRPEPVAAPGTSGPRRHGR
ncbi:MAG: NAD-dependent epimerase/dehydratase family protein [Mobilicoccus sp.]|nr:NAD-dependent epimerase/dehydratase family protein [Mobilicoccus sp.]